VPVWAEFLADVSTPVGLPARDRGRGPGLLFESVERSERWGPYSFVAGDPAAMLVADDDGVHLRDVVPRPLPPANRSRTVDVARGAPAVSTGCARPRLDGLPPITGGLMG
jgi:anthranilate synthase component 1